MATPSEQQEHTASSGSASPTELERVFAESRSHLWAIAYRMTGSVQDADDVVQDSFRRALERPPADTREPWLPWLVRVAMNLALDELRRRKRRPYKGPWLPAPVETEELASPAEVPSPEATYDLAESATFACLLALEALTPSQRAVLLLRSVFEYSVEETALLLGLTEANVKTTHHRARRALAAYDDSRQRPTPEAQAAAREAFQRLLIAIRTGDAEAIERALTPDAVSLTDANGKYLAALKPVVGARPLARWLVALARVGNVPSSMRPATINAMPALLFVWGKRRERDAPRSLLCCAARDGRVSALWWVLADEKVSHLRF